MGSSRDYVPWVNPRELIKSYAQAVQRAGGDQHEVLMTLPSMEVVRSSVGWRFDTHYVASSDRRIGPGSTYMWVLAGPFIVPCFSR